MFKPQFTVVIPLYNKAEDIERTLLTVQHQRYSPVKIIVVDDGSTDASLKVVESLRISNLEIIRQTNKGVSAARNAGAKAADTPYIAFLDADDLWSPFYLQEMAALISHYPNGGLYASNYQKKLDDDQYLDPKVDMPHIDPKGGILENYFQIAANGDLPFMTSSTIVTKTLFERIGGFPVGESMGEDQTVFAEAALIDTIVYSPMVLLVYRTESSNRACDINVPNDILPFAQRLLDRIDSVPAILQKDVVKYCAAHICHLAKINLQAGKFAQAARLLAYKISKHKPVHWLGLSIWCAYRSKFAAK